MCDFDVSQVGESADGFEEGWVVLLKYKDSPTVSLSAQQAVYMKRCSISLVSSFSTVML